MMIIVRQTAMTMKHVPYTKKHAIFDQGVSQFYHTNCLIVWWLDIVLVGQGRPLELLPFQQ